MSIQSPSPGNAEINAVIRRSKVQTGLLQAIEITDAVKENFLGLIYVGGDLKDYKKPGK
jgi:hypothetical protein